MSLSPLAGSTLFVRFNLQQGACRGWRCWVNPFGAEAVAIGSARGRDRAWWILRGIVGGSFMVWENHLTHLDFKRYALPLFYTAPFAFLFADCRPASYAASNASLMPQTAQSWKFKLSRLRVSKV